MDEDRVLEWLEKQVDNVLATKSLKRELKNDFGAILMCNDWVQVADGIELLANLTGNIIDTEVFNNGDYEEFFYYKEVKVLEYVSVEGK